MSVHPTSGMPQEGIPGGSREVLKLFRGCRLLAACPIGARKPQKATVAQATMPAATVATLPNARIGAFAKQPVSDGRWHANMPKAYDGRKPRGAASPASNLSATVAKTEQAGDGHPTAPPQVCDGCRPNPAERAACSARPATVTDPKHRRRSPHQGPAKGPRQPLTERAAPPQDRLHKLKPLKGMRPD